MKPIRPYREGVIDVAALVKRVALLVAGGLTLLAFSGVAVLGFKATGLLALALLIVVVVLLV